MVKSSIKWIQKKGFSDQFLSMIWPLAFCRKLDLLVELHTINSMNSPKGKIVAFIVARNASGA